MLAGIPPHRNSLLDDLRLAVRASLLEVRRTIRVRRHRRIHKTAEATCPFCQAWTSH
jgi:hypothetical protein